MPSVPSPDDFPYCAQDEDVPECVPACVVMVFEYLGIECTSENVAAQLDFDWQCGTPFENIANLAGVRVIPVACLDEIGRHLTGDDPAPVIANLLILNDEVLGYGLAPDPSLHAVVVLAVDAYDVTFSDPLSHAMLSTESHRVCSRAAVDQAWMGGFALRRLVNDQ